ncbi:exodeoxyribonuclease VII small subunit [Candidatus Protochlamydia phocaeensis]|uniref:exodeoxyribonuclease VII small subunit n=1 Tax=Candidatus Protochlamydia phocaeensis TaxID=1414722 RepID=UPI0008380F55|nr:exodeoxyribonuclease VII small subunit [Candidatus Protochlamydia phocaeensis]
MNNDTLQDLNTISFEAALARLETILERMNSGTISLDESLKLYEEADQLIAICNKRLNEAERKIEILVKNRSGELMLGSDDKPLTQDYKVNPSN